MKVCKDGFPSIGIDKIAWRDVAKENNTNLKDSYVEVLDHNIVTQLQEETMKKMSKEQ